MLTVDASQLETLTRDIFVAAGTPAEVAAHVARSLVMANLMGHDSHGVIRVPSYLEYIDKGTVVPAALPAVEKETETMALVDGRWGFGQIAAHRATTLAIAKAKARQVAMVGVVRCNHIGRLGEYTELAAQAGVAAFVVAGGFGPGGVAPFGGAKSALATNPFSFALPAGEGAPVVMDIATSVVAEGKLQVARAKHQPLPPGLILDQAGNPSTNADDFYAGGVLLPFGGHKGYALSVLVELLGGFVTGADVFDQARSWGTFVAAFDLEAFRPLAAYRAAAEARLDQIKSVPPAPGFQEVLLPGEPERRTYTARREAGIPLPDDTNLRLLEAAARLGVPVAADWPRA